MSATTLEATQKGYASVYTAWLANKKPGTVMCNGVEWKAIDRGAKFVMLGKQSGFEASYSSLTMASPQANYKAEQGFIPVSAGGPESFDPETGMSITTEIEPKEPEVEIPADAPDEEVEEPPVEEVEEDEPEEKPKPKAKAKKAKADDKE